MSSNNCHAETGSCMLIAVPLNEACEIEEGAPVHVTAGVGSYTWEVEREEGTDYSAKNFGGAECAVTQKADTSEKWLNGSGEFCLVDWAFMSATDGNPTVVDGTGNVVGYQKLARRSGGVCDALTKPRIAVVIIRRAAMGDGGCSLPTSATGMTPCVAHFFPVTTDWQWDVPPFEDARASIPFTSTGYTGGEAAGAGPLNLWPEGYDPNRILPEALWAPAFVECSALPAVDCDATIPHPAPDPRPEPSA